MFQVKGKKMKKNCWEFKGCGRQPGGKQENDKDKCLVPLLAMYDGINDGKNGGRVCWLIAGSACDGGLQTTFSHKLKSCVKCDFYKSVVEQEGANITLPLKVLEDLLCRMKPE